MQEWGRHLDHLHKAGFSYGYVAYVDFATGERRYQVDAVKGDGPRVVCEGLTMAGAVQGLMDQLQRMGTIGK